jgi:hypothetical protein
MRAAFVVVLLSRGIASHEAAMAMDIAPAATEAIPAAMTMTGMEHMMHGPIGRACTSSHCGHTAPACCVLEQCFIGVVPMPEIVFPPASGPIMVAALLLVRATSGASPPFRPPTLI